MYMFLVESPLRAWKKGDYPIAPFVHLAIDAGQPGEGHLLLSPQLKTEREIDETVDRLSKYLQQLKLSAKRELGVLKRQMLKE